MKTEIRKIILSAIFGYMWKIDKASKYNSFARIKNENQNHGQTHIA